MSESTRTVRLTVAAVALSFFLGNEWGRCGTDWTAELKAIQGSEPDPGGAVLVGRMSIVLGPARLEVTEGLLVPVRSGAGPPRELTFSGNAQFVVNSDDAVEARQLEIFTGAPRLDEPITDMVLVVPRDGTVEALLARGRKATTSERLPRAVAYYNRWKSSTERRSLYVESILLRVAVGDAPAQQFVAAYCTSPRFDFVFSYDPERIEAVRVGRFVPSGMNGHEQDLAAARIRAEQRSGRRLHARVEDYGTWDIWLSAEDETPNETPEKSGRGFDILAYRLAAEIDPNLEWLRASAAIDLRIQRQGMRALTFGMHPDLSVNEVTAAGRPLSFVQSEDRLTVFTELQADQTFTVKVKYAGAAFRKLQPGVNVSRISSWYPRGDSGDLASFDALLRFPRGKALVGSGRVVEQGEDGSYRWERRRLDLPSPNFGMEIGEYKLVREKVGHIEVTYGFLEGEFAAERDERDRIRDTVAKSLAFYESRFGSYPLDYLTVATTPPRGYSDAQFSFVRVDSEWVGRFVRMDLTAVPHEIGHQWWGHMLVMRSYRDHWLGEALAEYSERRYAAQAQPRDVPIDPAWFRNRKPRLLAATDLGIPVVAMGAVTLGYRLDSSVSTEAYDAILYDKGSLIFAMLTQLLGEDAFDSALRTIVESARGHPLDTELFFRAMEKVSGQDLGPFRRQFVYGTGLPDIYYEYEMVPIDGARWKAEVNLRVLPPWVEAYSLKPIPGGGWELVRAVDMAVLENGLELPVPCAAILGSAPTAAVKQNVLEGVYRFRVGNSSAGKFKLTADSKPERIWLDRFDSTLANYFDLTHDQKMAHTALGSTLSALGDDAEAQQAFEKALRADSVPPSRSSDAETEADRAVRDAGIHLALAKHHLEHQRFAEAQQALDSANGLLRGPERQKYAGLRAELQARIDVAEGHMEAAFERLSKVEDSYLKEISGGSWFDRWSRIASGRVRTAGGWVQALTAVSAHFTGHEKECKEARKRAREGGANVDELDRLHR